MSTAALLGLFSVNQGQLVHADTTTQAVASKNANSEDVENQNGTDEDKNTKVDADKVAATETDSKSDVAAKDNTNFEDSSVKTDKEQTDTDALDSNTESDNSESNKETTIESDDTTSSADNSPTIDDNSDTSAATEDSNNVDEEVSEPTYDVVYPTYISSSNNNTTPVTTAKKEEPKYKLNDIALEALKDAEIDPNSLTKEQLEQIDKIDFKGSNPDGSTKWTYVEYAGTAKKMLEQDKKYRVPYFNAKKMKNMPATTTKDAQTGKVESLDIWDSWPVQDAKTGKVYNYKGYQLVIAMMGIPGQNDSHIYLLYNKYKDNNLKHWKSAGPIFDFKANATNQEWSGSATVNKDGSIQLFYTDVDTSQGDNHQKISTVNLKLKVNKKKNTIKIVKRSHRHVLFEGDGKFYQTYDQWKSTNKGADNIAMRDAHVIEVKGRRYLVFESSTGTKNYQGEDQIYNWQNYGGTTKEALQNFLKITSNKDMTSRATWANASIGILRLSKSQNNPKVDKVMAPLVTSLMVSDEIERPNLIKMNGKYYLFATTRLNRGTGDDLWQAADNQIGDNVAMLGWVSDHLTYGYKPLNGDGTVLVASVPFNWRTATYSYYAVPVNGSKTKLLVTSYMTNRGFAAGKGKLSTLAPSFIISVKGDKTSVVQKATNQGDWVYDKKSVNKKMLTKTIKGAHLDGEPTDKSQLKLSEA